MTELNSEDELCPECGADLGLDVVVETEGFSGEPVMVNYDYCPDCDQHYEPVDQ